MDPALMKAGMTKNAKAVKNAGMHTVFPPEASAAGYRYYACKSTMTGTACVCSGWRCAEANFLNGRNWQNLQKGEIVGFADLEGAVKKMFDWYPRSWTITVRK